MQKLVLLGIILLILLICGYYWYKINKEEEPKPVVQEETESEAESPATTKKAQLQSTGDEKEASISNEPMDSLTKQIETQASDAVPHPFHRGMNLLIYGHPEEEEVRKMIKRLSQLGVNSVAIVFPLFQNGWQASQVTTDPEMTPTIQELEMVILAAKEEEVTVMLRPILDEQSMMMAKRWRGNILPQDIDAWFESYRLLLLDYARLAQAMGVELLNIGTELNSLQINKYAEQWINMIREIKEVYSGKLIYSFNWDAVGDIAESRFVPLLDYVGIDAYFPLQAPDQANEAMLEEAWQEWLPTIKPLTSVKPLMITEAGIIPVKGAHRTPYAWEIPGGVYDPEAQAHYYQATYRIWRPFTEGLYWWTVTLQPEEEASIDYSPLRQPTEAVLKHLFAE